LWGCQTPTQPVTPEIWDGWKYKESSIPARFTSSWGELYVGYGESMVSPIKDSMEVKGKMLVITLDNCEAPTGNGSIYWRGSNSVFAQDSDEITGPVWQLYTGATLTNLRYLQIMVVK